MVEYRIPEGETPCSFIRYSDKSTYGSTTPLETPKNEAAFAKRQLLEYQRQITELGPVYSCFPYDAKYPWPEEAILLFEKGGFEIGGCRRLNGCVVCASQRMSKLRKGYESDLQLWVDAGGHVYWQRFSHVNSEYFHIREKYKHLTMSWTEMIKARAYKKAEKQAGFPVYIRVIEETLTRKGWYPHLHVLWLIPPGVVQRSIETFLMEMTTLWVHASSKVLVKPPTAAAQYTDWAPVDLNEGTLTNYAFKHAYHDLTFDPLQADPFCGDYDPYEILQIYVETGDARLKKFFNSFELGSDNLRRVVPSRAYRSAIDAVLSVGNYEFQK